MLFTPVNNIKKNKDYLYGVIIGIIVSVTMVKQSVGIPFLFLLLAFSGSLAIPSKEYQSLALLIAIKLVFIIVVALNNSIIFDLNFGKLIIQRSVIDIIFFVMFFVSLKENTKTGFFNYCIFIFILDFGLNIYSYLHGVSIYGQEPHIRPGDIFGRVGGIFNSTFLSINISLAALIYGLSVKNRVIIFAALIGILINGSQRGYLAVLMIFIFIPLFYFNIRKFFINIVSFGIIFIVGSTVYLIAINYSNSSANKERVTRWIYGLKAIFFEPWYFNNFLRLDPQWFLNAKGMFMEVERKYFFINAESYYLTIAVNYGILVSMVTIIVFYFIYKERYLNYIALKNQKNLISLVFSYIIFIDGIFAYQIGSVYSIFFYCMVCVVAARDKIPQK